MRAALEAMRKALVGKLTEREFDKLRRGGEAPCRFDPV
jgi:hypothetical protein